MEKTKMETIVMDLLCIQKSKDVLSGSKLNYYIKRYTNNCKYVTDESVKARVK